MNINFGTPPSTTRKAYATRRWANEAEALRGRPGEWAHFEEVDSKSRDSRQSFAYGVKSGVYKAFPAGEFEARVANGQVWVRYVGPTS